MTIAYTQDLIKQRDRAMADLRAAEDELGKRRQQVADLTDELSATRARVIRYRNAWQNARCRAAEYRAAVDRTVAAAERGTDDLARIAHDQLTRAEQAEARIAAVRELHNADRSNPLGPWCPECTCSWPCPTITAFDEARP
jgi:predicted  nucleic acid-binding Zn-ribbon protein